MLRFVLSTRSNASALGPSALSRQLRQLSMPSRADTRPFQLLRLKSPDADAADENVARLSTRSAAGLFAGTGASRVSEAARRAHALSPMVPADAILRAALQRGRNWQGEAAMAVLAEQTISVSTSGSAAVWITREGAMIAGARGTDSARERVLTTQLRPGDLVALVANAGEWPEDEIAAVTSAGGVSVTDSRISFWLQCAAQVASETWAPLRDDAPHPSWAQTVFNEYGTHNPKPGMK